MPQNKSIAIPPRADPRWREIVIDNKIREFCALPTKMLMMRIHLLVRDGRPQKIDEAIDILFDFFSKNSNVVLQDIELLFGSDSFESKRNLK